MRIQIDGDDEVSQHDRICVVFGNRAHRARIDAIKRRRWNPESHEWDGPAHDTIEFRTVENDEQIGRVPLADEGLKWAAGWDAETMTVLLAANALATLSEPITLLSSHTGRPTWVL